MPVLATRYGSASCSHSMSAEILREVRRGPLLGGPHSKSETGSTSTLIYCRAFSRAQDVKTGLHKGFGWVRMSSEQEIENVLDYKRHTIEGYEVYIYTYL